MVLHKKVRAAYRAIEALDRQDIRRGMVTSSGRKVSIVEGELIDQARDAVREALAALDEAQKPPPTWQ